MSTNFKHLIDTLKFQILWWQAVPVQVPETEQQLHSGDITFEGIEPPPYNSFYSLWHGDGRHDVSSLSGPGIRSRDAVYLTSSALTIISGVPGSCNVVPDRTGTCTWQGRTRKNSSANLILHTHRPTIPVSLWCIDYPVFTQYSTHTHT